MKMKPYIVPFFACVCLLLTLAGCADRYRPDDFLGKNSAEIMARYGEFDCVYMPADEDGLYRNSKCGYTIKEPKRGFLGTSPEVLLFISFDEYGIAVSCDEGYRPGG